MSTVANEHACGARGAEASAPASTCPECEVIRRELANLRASHRPHRGSRASGTHRLEASDVRRHGGRRGRAGRDECSS